MSPSLNVIALISGGKDSFFSILHCLANGHSVVALANLRPPLPSDGTALEEDINSFMYQTVGHTIIPLYEEALGLPLYRQEIFGGAINSERDYAAPKSHQGQDETESLVPLLEKIKAAHPEVNAISTGAILSTYQRTRVESVALRLGLTPLSFIWQYPFLPPYKESALLRDMTAVGQDARIIKVASGGLDETFLWESVADPRTITRLGNAVGRFSENGDGAVLGEGGEFETLAVDGPSVLWKKRIEVEPDRVIVGDGGTAIWTGKAARVVAKEGGETAGLDALRIPDLWDNEFNKVLETLETERESSADMSTLTTTSSQTSDRQAIPQNLLHSTKSIFTLSNRTRPLIPSESDDPEETEASKQLFWVLADIVDVLIRVDSLDASSILHTTLLLRNMPDFASVNKVYNKFFTTPNPPSRVTVACGDALPAGVDVMLSITAARTPPPDSTSPASQSKKAERQGLHVQSRSYWAPANIGPYSQAISTPLILNDIDTNTSTKPEVVYIAGQIPLIPASMDVYTSHGFIGQTVLALQHLFRIGRTMKVRHWVAGVAYISDCSDAEALTRVRIAQSAWREIHAPPTTQAGDENEDEAEDVDPWYTKHQWQAPPFNDDIQRAALPDRSRDKQSAERTPCFVVQVASLPRDVDVEWSSIGIAGADTNVIQTSSESDVLQLEPLGTKARFYSVEIEKGDDVDLCGLVQDWDHGTLYAAPGFRWSGEELKGVQWVPCKAVWGAHGGGVDAVLVGRSEMVDG